MVWVWWFGIRFGGTNPNYQYPPIKHYRKIRVSLPVTPFEDRCLNPPKTSPKGKLSEDPFTPPHKVIGGFWMSRVFSRRAFKHLKNTSFWTGFAGRFEGSVETTNSIATVIKANCIYENWKGTSSSIHLLFFLISSRSFWGRRVCCKMSSLKLKNPKPPLRGCDDPVPRTKLGLFGLLLLLPSPVFTFCQLGFATVWCLEKVKTYFPKMVVIFMVIFIPDPIRKEITNKNKSLFHPLFNGKP